MSKEDRAKMKEFYDAFGVNEWDRFDKDIPGKVNLEVHEDF